MSLNDFLLWAAFFVLAVLTIGNRLALENVRDWVRTLDIRERRRLQEMREMFHEHEKEVKSSRRPPTPLETENPIPKFILTDLPCVPSDTPERATKQQTQKAEDSVAACKTDFKNTSLGVLPSAVSRPSITEILAEIYDDQNQTKENQNMQTLWEISDEMLEFEQLMTDLDGEIPNEEIERQLDEWFERIGAARDEKLDGYAALIKTLEARSKVRKEEAARLSKLAATDENAMKRLKDRLKYFFERHELSVVNTRRYKLALQNNGGVKPVILTTDVTEHPEELPEDYRKVVFTPNLTAIRESLESGEKLEFATLGERGKSIRIR